MTLQELYQYYGSPSEARLAINVSRACFSMWRKRGYIPPLAQMRIERLTQGKLKAEESPSVNLYNDDDIAPSGYLLTMEGKFMQITEEDKKRVRNYLKNRFKVLRSIMTTLENDMRSEDATTQATAIFISGNFLAMATDFFTEWNKRDDQKPEDVINE